MTTDIIKFILCSGLFLLVYKLFLENERIYNFNRFYLLFALTFSVVMPFITIGYLEEAVPNLHYIVPDAVRSSADESPDYMATAGSSGSFSLVLAVYLVVTTLLIFRFVRNISLLLGVARRSTSVRVSSTRLILLEEKTDPHSFLNLVFLNKNDYESGRIEPEILRHEFAHVHQKHSWDVVFIELCQIFFWFNPFIFLYRRALLLNHEFLADEGALAGDHDVHRYQRLLLGKASNQISFMSSQFNYSITKKRLLMITKSTTRAAFYKQLALIPGLIAAIFFFGRVAGQEKVDGVSKTILSVPFTKEGVGKAELQEYDSIVSRTQDARGFPQINKLSDQEKKRLEMLFVSMSKEQQARQTVIFMRTLPPFEKSVPGADQLGKWKNSKVYGVWIDGKRVANTELDKYASTDFAHMFVSKLYPNAVNYKNHSFQVDLMTTAYYDNYYKTTIEANEKRKYLVGVKWKNQNPPVVTP